MRKRPLTIEFFSWGQRWRYCPHCGVYHQRGKRHYPVDRAAPDGYSALCHRAVFALVRGIEAPEVDPDVRWAGDTEGVA